MYNITKMYFNYISIKYIIQVGGEKIWKKNCLSMK